MKDKLRVKGIVTVRVLGQEREGKAAASKLVLSDATGGEA